MKKIILLLIAAIILVTGALIGIDYLNKKPVNFAFDANDYSVTVFDKSDNKIADVTKDTGLRLAKGEYSYQVNGDGLDANYIPFTVGDESMTVQVTSQLSDQRKQELLENERESIELIINTNYSSKSAFTIEDMALYKRGDWASAKLIVDIPQQAPETYRVVLHKENNAWSIKIPPTIAINQSEYKDVPKEIIDDLYRY